MEPYYDIDRAVVQQVDYPHPSPALTFDFPSALIETCFVHGRPWVHRGETLARFAVLHGLKTIVELGVSKGETFSRLLDMCPNAVVHGIDRWAPAETESADAPEDWSHWPHQEHLAHVRTIASRHPGRACIHRMNTTEAASLFPDHTVDMVFVDADHSYAGVTKDIDAWLPKVRAGGWMLGHDIDWTTVRAAVHDRLGSDLQYGMDAVWAWRVPEAST